MLRATADQTQHDLEVRRLAISYTTQNYSVAADIAGYMQPYKIGGYIPDLIATKGVETIIIEVETKGSENSAHAKKQKAAFEAEAKSNLFTTFQQIVV